ncbi:hypothetical protein PLEOSDRAFT_156445 [Pleurotus ostreatus PC15]|uniref:Uncharacterized protein n=1 Tax=Pleurotus ostreatus (strain PC15) TaxID=1137138 RepID=A0A067NKV3_PLEO1|nr:hypothetical protein PLEOSDRAFT_156445 [Pleurotus ostreatus PC15]
MTSKTLIIDGAETSQIRYSAGWSFLPGNDNEYLHTVSHTTTKGAQFTFDFNGTSIKVYGSLSVRNNDIATLPNTSYVLDGGSPVLFRGNPSANDDHRYQQVFYSSPPLPYGNHSLIGTSVDEGGKVWIDYLVVEVPNNLHLKTVISESLHAKSTPSAAAILCGVLGGLLLIMTALSLYLWCQYRRALESKSLLDLLDEPPPPSSASSTFIRNHDTFVCVESHKSAIPQQQYVSSPPGSFA